MASLRQIAVINGRPSIWGDAALALCKASGELEDFKEYVEGDYEDMVATVKVKRRGFSRPVVQTFSVDDAKRAGLLGKSGPWQQYRARMLKLRARGFAFRDTFADVLQGLYLAEEAQDIPPDEPKPRKVDSRAVTNDALAALPDHSDSSPAVTGVIKPPNDEPEAKTERMEQPRARRRRRGCRRVTSRQSQARRSATGSQAGSLRRGRDRRPAAARRHASCAEGERGRAA